VKGEGNIDLDGGEAKYYNIDILKTFDGKGKLINTNYTIIEDKSKEAGVFVHGALYRPPGDLGSGTLFTYSQTTVKNLTTSDRDILSQEIKSEDIGSLYVPSPEDRGRGGLYFVSSKGGFTHASGDLKGKDAIPINVDALVDAIGGFPSGSSGGEIEKLRKLPGVLLSDKKIIDKVEKFLSSFKALYKTEKSGEKLGKVTEKIIDGAQSNKKPTVDVYSGGTSPSNRLPAPQGHSVSPGNNPDTNFYTQPLHKPSDPKQKQ